MRSRLAAGLLLAGLTLSAAPGCSMILADAVEVDPWDALRPGAPRNELADVLGSPSSTDTVPPGEYVEEADPAARPVVRDVCEVSGRFRYSGVDFAARRWVHGMGTLGTLGLLEPISIPRVLWDFVTLSFEDWEIYAWYDAADRLVAWGRRRIDAPGDDTR